MDRLRLATVWLAGCSGCHMSFLDLDEWLLELAAMADLVYSPILDTKQFPDNVDVTLVEGAVANHENLEMLRDRSQTVESARFVWRLRGDRKRHGPAKPIAFGAARSGS